MARASFPRPGGRKPAFAALLVLLAAGCGHSTTPTAHLASARIAGNGYSFLAPRGWRVVRSGRATAASPARGPETVSVTIFRLARPFRPELWPRVVPALDGVVDRLASELGGRRTRSATVVRDGRRTRSYEIAFERSGDQLVEELTFVLRGRREYQLLCRRPAQATVPACALLAASFRPA